MSYLIMEISKGTLRIESKQNIIPSDIEAVGLGTDGYVIIKYKINDKINYIQYLLSQLIKDILFVLRVPKL